MGVATRDYPVQEKAEGMRELHEIQDDLTRGIGWPQKNEDIFQLSYYIGFYSNLELSLLESVIENTDVDNIYKELIQWIIVDYWNKDSGIKTYYGWRKDEDQLDSPLNANDTIEIEGHGIRVRFTPLDYPVSKAWKWKVLIKTPDRWFQSGLEK